MTTAELELTTTSAPTLNTGTTMKALVYHGPGERAWENKPRPTIQDPGDAIVRITTSTICGTDLHILRLGGYFYCLWYLADWIRSIFYLPAPPAAP